MQRDIALIADEDWQAGPEAVAARIEIIEERYRLRQEIADLKVQLQRMTDTAVPDVATLAHRSHNHPPDLVDATAAIRQSITIIWDSLDEADRELAKVAPEPTVLMRIGQAILEATKAIASYCVTLGDIALRKAAEEIGSTGTRWVIGVGATLFAANTGPVQSLAKGLFELAQKLLAGG